MADTVGRFLKLKDSITKALIDLKSNIKFDDEDITLLNDIHQSLSVIKATVSALCRRDATLLSADACLKFMLRKLDEADNTISRNLASALRMRVKQRRLIISGVIQFQVIQFSTCMMPRLSFPKKMMFFQNQPQMRSTASLGTY